MAVFGHGWRHTVLATATAAIFSYILYTILADSQLFEHQSKLDAVAVGPRLIPSDTVQTTYAVASTAGRLVRLKSMHLSGSDLLQEAFPIISTGAQQDSVPTHLSHTDAHKLPILATSTAGNSLGPAATAAAKSLDWEQSKAWVRAELERIAVADAGPAGWRADASSPESTAQSTVASQLGPVAGRKVLAASRRTSEGSTLPQAAPAAPAAGPTAAGAGAPYATALVVMTTSGVWEKTEQLLLTLSGCHDRFELLVIDEMSKDGTPEKLAQLGVRVLQTPGVQGVTANWNLAYQHWQRSLHSHMFIINNDVLLPDGVLDRLTSAMQSTGPNCDLIGPLSTAKGKGYWGTTEGIEHVFALPPVAAAFVQNPLNFGRVQAVLDAVPAAEGVMVRDSGVLHNTGFSGFFFGMRRTIDRAAHDAAGGLLFDPAGGRIIGQEGDLFRRMQPVGAMKVCLHASTFVYHHKGSTIGAAMSAEREQFRATGLKRM